ncbi:MAG TPA: hypothetical protein VIV57_22255 [Anaeromyxobacter sp.]
MEAFVECTHCRVVMTSWSAPGSTIRYYQCPFCQRTHSSLYGEVFKRRAGARMVDAKPRAAAPGIPMPSPEDVRWAHVKAKAARWFARLEADEQRCAVRTAPPGAEVPEADPADVVELAAASRRIS